MSPEPDKKPPKKVQPFLDFMSGMDNLRGRVKTLLVSEAIRKFMGWPPFGIIVKGTQVFEVFCISSLASEKFIFKLETEQETNNRLAAKYVRLNKHGSETKPRPDRGPGN